MSWSCLGMEVRSFGWQLPLDQFPLVRSHWWSMIHRMFELCLRRCFALPFGVDRPAHRGGAAAQSKVVKAHYLDLGHGHHLHLPLYCLEPDDFLYYLADDAACDNRMLKCQLGGRLSEHLWSGHSDALPIDVLSNPFETQRQRTSSPHTPDLGKRSDPGGNAALGNCSPHNTAASSHHLSCHKYGTSHAYPCNVRTIRHHRRIFVYRNHILDAP